MGEVYTCSRKWIMSAQPPAAASMSSSTAAAKRGIHVCFVLDATGALSSFYADILSYCVLPLLKRLADRIAAHGNEKISLLFSLITFGSRMSRIPVRVYPLTDSVEELLEWFADVRWDGGGLGVSSAVMAGLQCALGKELWELDYTLYTRQIVVITHPTSFAVPMHPRTDQQTGVPSTHTRTRLLLENISERKVSLSMVAPFDTGILAEFYELVSNQKPDVRYRIPPMHTSETAVEVAATIIQYYSESLCALLFGRQPQRQPSNPTQSATTTISSRSQQSGAQQPAKDQTAAARPQNSGGESYKLWEGRLQVSHAVVETAIMVRIAGTLDQNVAKLLTAMRTELQQMTTLKVEGTEPVPSVTTTSMGYIPLDFALVLKAKEPTAGDAKDMLFNNLCTYYVTHKEALKTTFGKHIAVLLPPADASKSSVELCLKIKRVGP